MNSLFRENTCPCCLQSSAADSSWQQKGIEQVCSILKSTFVTAIVYSCLPDVPLKILSLSLSMQCVRLPCDFQCFHLCTQFWLRAGEFWFSNDQSTGFFWELCVLWVWGGRSIVGLCSCWDCVAVFDCSSGKMGNVLHWNRCCTGVLVEVWTNDFGFRVLGAETSPFGNRI